jgi:phosphate transport system substrate-binding protein
VERCEPRPACSCHQGVWTALDEWHPRCARRADPDEGLRHKKACTTIREDGAFVDAGENDNLIVQKLLADPQALGIFGYSFLEENAEALVGNPINGIAPTYASISDFSYPGARPLFIYVKSAHLKAIKGLQGFVSEFASAWGPEGYLKKRGMVIAPAEVRAAAELHAKDMKPLDPTTLK